MKILKAADFSNDYGKLLKFVNTNGIKKEDILTITTCNNSGADEYDVYTVFYYEEE